MNQDIRDARDLYLNVCECLKIFDKDSRAKETEVSVRHNSIRGILLMSRNDIYEMLTLWKENKGEV